MKKTLLTLLAVILMAGTAMAGSVALNWTAPTAGQNKDPLAGYTVFKSDTPGQYCRAGTYPKWDFSTCILDTDMKETTSTSMIWSNLVSGTYYFVVTAHDIYAEYSNYSNEISIYIPPVGDGISHSDIKDLTGECSNVTVNNCIGCVNQCD